VLAELIDRLNQESEALLYELNVTLPGEIERAVAQGDLRENSEYTAALERQRLVHARLDHISRRLSEIHSVELDAIPTDRVGFGSRVELIDLEEGDVEAYTLAFGDFIDFEKSEISMASPIGRALLGRKVGEEVTVVLPGGGVRYRIQSLITLPEMAGDHAERPSSGGAS